MSPLKCCHFFMYALAPVALPLLRSTSEVLCWYGNESCACVTLNIFYRCKTVTLEPSLDSWEEPKVAWVTSGENGGWGVVAVWFFTKTVALQGRYNRVHCNGAEVNCISFAAVFWMCPYKMPVLFTVVSQTLIWYHDCEDCGLIFLFLDIGMPLHSLLSSDSWPLY